MTISKFFPVDKTRRHFLTVAAGAAVATAAPATAAPAEPDPIYATIERHRRAYQDYLDNVGEDEIEAAVPAEHRLSSLVGALHGRPDWQVPGDDPRWIAHVETAVRTSDELENAAIALVSSENLTLAGALALLQYAADVEAKDGDVWPCGLADDDDKQHSWHFFLMEQVAAALAVASAKGAQS